MERARSALGRRTEMRRICLLVDALQDRPRIDAVESAEPADDALRLFPMRERAKAALHQAGEKVKDTVKDATN